MSGAAPHFFISRAGPDGPYAVKIANILEEAGYRVFIQDRDIFNESIMAAMHQELTRSERTIALLSKDYLDPKRVHCAAEWQATIAHDPLNQKRRLIVFKVGECAPTGLLKALAYWDLVPVGGNDELLRDIVLGAVHPDAGKSLPEAIARYWREVQPIVHHAIAETPSFAGRADAMADIDAALSAGEAAAITQSRVAVHGMGGIGKSTLARQFTWQASRSDRYSGIWWLGASRNPSTGGFDGVESALLELRDTLYPGTPPPKEREPAARAMLDYIANGGFQRPWLLVYDNVDDMAVLRDWKPPANCHVLLTTRLTTFRKGEVAPVAIKEWALPEAVDYLLRESGRDDITTAEAEAIAAALGSLPLALAHAAAYLREVPTATAKSYLAAIERRMRSVPPGMADAKSVYATFQEAIDQAETQAAGAKAVMTFAALLAPDDIPMELYRQEPSKYATDLAAVLADPDGLEAATGALARMSLIDFDRATDAFSVHRLVQAAALDGLDAEARKTGITSVLEVMVAAHPGYDFAQWSALERLLPHARALANSATDDMGATLGVMLNQLGRYYNDRAAYDIAEPIYRRSLRVREHALGPEHAAVGESYNNLGLLYLAQGKYDLCEQFTKCGLDIREKALGPEHTDVAASCNNLALLYRAQGRYDLAEPLYERDRAICEKELGPYHPDLGATLSNLAGFYRAQDKLDLAEPLYRRAIEICEKCLVQDHPNLGAVLNNLAELYRQQKKYHLAEPLYHRSISIAEKANGPDDPNVGSALNNLALLHRAQGKNDLAEPLFQRALAISELKKGAGHRDTALTLLNLAELFADTGRIDDAFRSASRAGSILRRVLPPGHQDQRRAMQTLAEIARIKPGRR